MKKSLETDFLTFRAKEAFSRLRKAFTKAPILRHFDSEYNIRIEIDTSEYAIGRVFSQIAFNQYFSDHVTHKDPNSEIGQ